MNGLPERELFVKVDDRDSGRARVTTHRYQALAIGATHYVRADIADEHKRQRDLLLVAAIWSVDRLDVDDGMTDKEQKTTARRLLALIAKCEVAE